MTKEDELNMLDAILEFYGFRIIDQGSSCTLETYGHRYVGLKTFAGGVTIYLFASRHDLLKIIISSGKSFICGICDVKRIQNIFLGCKSLEEVHVKIDLNANLKV